MGATMARIIFKTIENNVKHWYLHLLIGILFLAVGIWTLASPLASYLALSVLFTVTFLVSGLFEIIFSLSNRRELDNWGWMLASGIFSFVIGVLLFINPELSIVTLPYYVGFSVLFRSVGAISTSIDLKHYGVRDWGNLLAVGVLGLLFSFILIWNPLFAGMTIVFWTALAFLTAGVFAIYFSFKLKKLKNTHGKISPELRDRYTKVQEEISRALHV